MPKVIGESLLANLIELYYTRSAWITRYVEDRLDKQSLISNSGLLSELLMRPSQYR